VKNSPKRALKKLFLSFWTRC